MTTITLIFCGFLLAVLCADTLLTRDAIRRSGGRIVEGNKLMRWFMETDARAALITVVEAVFLGGSFTALFLAGAWWGVMAVCVFGIIGRGRVVIKNYKLNVRIM